MSLGKRGSIGLYNRWFGLTALLAIAKPDQNAHNAAYKQKKAEEVELFDVLRERFPLVGV